jgi:hypothetical protein
MVTISAGHHASNNVQQNIYGITRSHAPAHFTCQPYQGGGLSEKTLNILQEKKGHAISLYTKIMFASLAKIVNISMNFPSFTHTGT